MFVQLIPIEKAFPTETQSVRPGKLFFKFNSKRQKNWFPLSDKEHNNDEKIKTKK